MKYNKNKPRKIRQVLAATKITELMERIS